MNISKKVEKIPPSGIREFFELVLGMKDIISLGVGEPDFVTPWNIRESAIFSLEKGYTSYTSNQGIYDLRSALSKFLKHRYGLEYSPKDEILITVGVSEGMDLAVRAILNDGDKVLIPEPCYVSYNPVVSLAGGEPVYLHASKSNGFKLNARDIEKACDKKTRAIILNYPSNPTGCSYREKELRDISKVIIKKDLILISDEIYGELTYDFRHVSLASFKGMKERTIYLNGFSKAYAMTGWRIGYACAPAKIIGGMNKIHQYTMLCASIMSQMAACEALRNGVKSVEEMKTEYRRRRDYICNELNKMGLEVKRPEGAFYVFPSIKKTGYKSIKFAKDLLKKEKVAVVPGVAFGPSGEGHIRISYASSMDNLREAVKRMKNFLSRL